MYRIMLHATYLSWHLELNLLCTLKTSFGLRKLGLFFTHHLRDVQRFPTAFFTCKITQKVSYAFLIKTFHYEFLLCYEYLGWKAADIYNLNLGFLPAIWEDRAEWPGWWKSHYCWAVANSWQEASLTKDSPGWAWFCRDSSSYCTGLWNYSEKHEDNACTFFLLETGWHLLLGFILFTN